MKMDKQTHQVGKKKRLRRLHVRGGVFFFLICLARFEVQSQTDTGVSNNKTIK